MRSFDIQRRNNPIVDVPIPPQRIKKWHWHRHERMCVTGAEFLSSNGAVLLGRDLRRIVIVAQPKVKC